jgi:hypothetical protein
MSAVGDALALLTRLPVAMATLRRLVVAEGSDRHPVLRSSA